MPTAPKTPRIKFAVRVLAVTLCLAIGLSGIVIPAQADPAIDAMLAAVDAELATLGIDSNIGGVTAGNSSNYTAVKDLYFEKWTTVGDPNTAIGKITFTSSLDFTDPQLQQQLLALKDKMDMSEGHIAFDVRDLSVFQGISVSLVIYGLPLGITLEQLQVSDDNGNILVASEYVSEFSQDPITGDVTFDAIHFTQFDIIGISTFQIFLPLVLR